jgi:hypothetical protein
MNSTWDGSKVEPAIAIPVPEKPSFDCCPPLHVKTLTDILPRTKRMVVIGLKGGEHAFLNLLRRHVQHRCPRLVAAANTHERSATTDAIGLPDPRTLVPLEGAGFSAMLSQGALRDFLAKTG